MKNVTLSFLAAAAIGTVSIGSVSAMPVNNLAGLGESHFQDVRLVCDRYGRCYNTRRAYRSYSYAQPYYGGGYYSGGYGPGYGYYGGPRVGIGVGPFSSASGGSDMAVAREAFHDGLLCLDWVTAFRPLDCAIQSYAGAESVCPEQGRYCRHAGCGGIKQLSRK